MGSHYRAKTGFHLSLRNLGVMEMCLHAWLFFEKNLIIFLIILFLFLLLVLVLCKLVCVSKKWNS